LGDKGPNFGNPVEKETGGLRVNPHAITRRGGGVGELGGNPCFAGTKKK